MMSSQPRADRWMRVLAVAVGFAAIDELLIVPLAASFDAAAATPVALPQRLGWAAVASGITAWALAFVAGRIRSTVEQRFVAFFVFLAGLDLAAHAQGAYFFRPDMDAATFTGIVVQAWCASAVLAALAAYAFRGDADDPDVGRPRGFRLSDLGWLWRIPASGAIYFVLFMIAGLIILPFVQDFYAEQLTSGRVGLLLFEWEYLNGVWFALLALPVLRLATGGWMRAGITIGVALSLIRGIAGLIVPNPSMPASIRLWHMFEVGWSNFAYGLAIAFVFLRTRPATDDT